MQEIYELLPSFLALNAINKYRQMNMTIYPHWQGISKFGYIPWWPDRFSKLGFIIRVPCSIGISIPAVYRILPSGESPFHQAD